MGLFNYTKKNTRKSENYLGESFDVLTKEGDLPVGWIYKNKSFIDATQRDFSHFLNLWLESKNKSPKEYYSSLKSFVIFLEDMERICKLKSECFEFWFYQIIASKDYIAKRKEELNELTTNFDSIQKIWEETLTIKSKIIRILKENDGILQSDLKKLFNTSHQMVVSNTLYEMYNSGDLKKVKSGRSYTLHYIGR